MHYDFSNTSNDLIYKLLASAVVPRPIAWVTTCSKTGNINAAPFSFFNMMGSEPPIVALGLQANGANGNKSLKDTARNILETGEFVVNLVTLEMAALMNATSQPFPAETNELEACGIATLPAKTMSAPLIKDAPIQLECVVTSKIQTGTAQYVILGEVKIFHIQDQFLEDAENGYINTEALALISRMHGRGWYAKNQDLFQIDRPD